MHARGETGDRGVDDEAVAVMAQHFVRERQRSSAIVMQDVQRHLFTDSVTAALALDSPADGLSVARSETLLHELDLHEFGGRHPLSLSAGQQQRLVVATARLACRSIVVFDEPSSGVDRRGLASITRILRDLAGDGAVVVVISHDEDLLSLAADHGLALAPPPG